MEIVITDGDLRHLLLWLLGGIAFIMLVVTAIDWTDRRRVKRAAKRIRRRMRTHG